MLVAASSGSVYSSASKMQEAAGRIIDMLSALRPKIRREMLNQMIVNVDFFHGRIRVTIVDSVTLNTRVVILDSYQQMEAKQ